ncbi:unnamed protein product [Meganyctiphanes norvegica]|uniref:BTB domain-containing protein n=1 Tax=Meganyctiphanes norvegica TaxID=48144 RepID=A0AAV2QJS8_MEGNR
MDVELSSLKWNNQHTTFYQTISRLQNKDSYADVTLVCGGKHYPVHKLVLVTCSEFFWYIFQFQTTEFVDQVVILTDIQCSDLELLLEFMYNGQVHVKQHELSSLMEAAECLKVKGLAVPDEEPEEEPEMSDQEILEQQSPLSKRKRTDEP